MPAPAPFFSIILVCRNPGPRLSDALASIWSQRDADFETIVIDGASTDGAREWLEERRAQIATLRSEPDRGVYDAMNKGLAAARGEWILFLGADDRFSSDDVLAQAARHVTATDAGVVVGEAVYDNGRIYRREESPNAVRRNFVHHQAAFYRRDALAEAGEFDANLRVMGDYDLNLRLERAGVRFESLSLRIAECASGGLSDAGAWTGYREEITVRHRHFPAWRCWLWDLGSVVRYGRKKVVRSQARQRPE